ncbi:MAG TPA: alpha/beta hydrolase, partial [Candidatus Merdiplasma excrementigallinarum]|nr:alpha/beta hydrolase [Candidatus Merdiplasma excrementigallinarum]
MAYFKYQDKSVFYEEYGQGKPVIFLHGNTASSKMSELLMPLYAENFRCILIDFLGNGQSERVEKFSPDMWYDEALQTIALTEHLQYGKVSLIGTSGGAWAAVNAALE